ncbi:unnamed protein product [Orchesella dallaii]|uniref:RBR-type E3 ubiquitin transferase n=1 Tax=Orchesella dallaii TaxID=48710 RepID=A0ABP1Q4Q8_9HEXA
MAEKRDAPEKLDENPAIKKPKIEPLHVEANNEDEDIEDDQDYEEGQVSSDDDYSEVNDCCEIGSEPSSSEYNYSTFSPEIQILTSESLPSEMKNLLSLVEQNLKVSSSDAYLLLNHFSWDAQTLYEKYYDDNNEEYFRKNGLPYTISKFECHICFSSFTKEESVDYPTCGHNFCSPCLFEYIKTRISENGFQSSIQCPEPNCNTLFKDDFIKNVIKTDLELVQRYDLILINDFVNKNKYLKYCPGERCDAIWRMNWDGVPWNFQEVACKCGESYCFSCNKKWHFPLSCTLHEFWLKNTPDDFGNENLRWIQTNTKSCPKCLSNIQKNGGCNQMTCKKCGFKFCWLCLKPWAKHGILYCNDADILNNAESAAAKNHLRFLFAYDRFVAYGLSYDLERKMLEEAPARMCEIKSAMQMKHPNEAWFYEDAIKGLLICRKLLQYSFPFVHYLERGSQVEIFETNMNHLHEAVTDLFFYLAQDQSPKFLGENKLKVMNLTNFCKQRRKVLIEHVNEGYIIGGKWSWSFNKVLAPELG